jgi:hypothetical protein
MRFDAISCDSTECKSVLYARSAACNITCCGISITSAGVQSQDEVEGWRAHFLFVLLLSSGISSCSIVVVHAILYISAPLSQDSKLCIIA